MSLNNAWTRPCLNTQTSLRRSFKERAAKFSKAQQVAEAERLAKKLQDKTQELEALRDEQDLFEEASEYRQKLARAELDLNSKTADLHFAQVQIDTTTAALKNVQGPLEEKRQQCIAANQQHRKQNKKVCHCEPANYLRYAGVLCRVGPRLVNALWVHSAMCINFAVL